MRALPWQYGVDISINTSRNKHTYYIIWDPNIHPVLTDSIWSSPDLGLDNNVTCGDVTYSLKIPGHILHPGRYLSQICIWANTILLRLGGWLTDAPRDAQALTCRYLPIPHVSSSPVRLHPILFQDQDPSKDLRSARMINPECFYD